METFEPETHFLAVWTVKAGEKVPHLLDFLKNLVQQNLPSSPRTTKTSNKLASKAFYTQSTKSAEIHNSCFFACLRIPTQTYSTMVFP